MQQIKGLSQIHENKLKFEKHIIFIHRGQKVQRSEVTNLKRERQSGKGQKQPDVKKRIALKK